MHCELSVQSTRRDDIGFPSSLFDAEIRRFLHGGESTRAVSPSKRHGPETEGGSPSKLRRMAGGESLRSKFTEVFYDSDEASLPELDFGMDSDGMSPLSDMADLDLEKQAEGF